MGTRGRLKDLKKQHIIPQSDDILEQEVKQKPRTSIA